MWWRVLALRIGAYMVEIFAQVLVPHPRFFTTCLAISVAATFN